VRRASLLAGVALMAMAVAQSSEARESDRATGATALDPGWRLPTVTGVKGNRVYTSSGTRCGASKFGTWRLRNGVKLPGRRGYVVYRVRLTGNQKLHKPKLIRFHGNLGSQIKQRTRRLLRNVKFRYDAGPPKTAQSIRRNGNVQATRPFDPVRRRC
jgi:hypothetical protein